MKDKAKYPLTAVLLMAVIAACSTQSKLYRIRQDPPSAGIAISTDKQISDSLPRNMPELDTLIIRNIDGRDMILMRSVRDDDGQMVANQVLEAAYVTARFRNVAERHGKVDLEFQVIVPASLQGSKWQLRYNPVMCIMQDTVHLDKVIITGRDYRKRQLRGYQQYQRFLDKIITDSTELIHLEELEIFIRRNIPRLYAFRSDSSFVSDENFLSVFGVSEKAAIDHYTDKFLCRINKRRIERKDKMYHRYVKAPIITDGIRLDTVMTDSNGDYVYNYIQTINTRPGLRRADIFLTAELWEQDRRLCRLDSSDILNFYISSLSAFADDRDRFITRIIERKVETNSSFDIAFPSGESVIHPSLGNNAGKLQEIKDQLNQLLENETFDLDSVIVIAYASPEGSYSSNKNLSRKRGQSVADYFGTYMKHKADSLNAEKGLTIDLDGGSTMDGDAHVVPIPFTGRFVAENWEGLDNIVETDATMSDEWKEAYFSYKNITDPDLRENTMRKEPWYHHLRTDLYPSLRKVCFHFHLHRKGMVKDTVHTTVPDTIYREGVRALKDHDYEKALNLLMPYGDYNTAVAYCALDRNINALKILEQCEKTAQVNYMLALIHSRNGNDREAVRKYLESCAQNPQYIHRGNLDPEISRLIKDYGLETQITQY